MQLRNRPRSGFTLVEIMIVVGVIGLLAAIAIPGFVRARETSQLNAVVSNLRVIEGAKDQWALENRKGTGATVPDTDLGPYMKNGLYPPTLIIGETYAQGPVGIAATATTPVKLGTYMANSVVTLP